MCGGSDTPSNPCFQHSPDAINTLMGSLAYAACGPSPSGICPTPTGPFTGNGYYSWYTRHVLFLIEIVLKVEILQTQFIVMVLCQSQELHQQLVISF